MSTRINKICNFQEMIKTIIEKNLYYQFSTITSIILYFEKNEIINFYIESLTHNSFGQAVNILLVKKEHQKVSF